MAAWVQSPARMLLCTPLASFLAQIHSPRQCPTSDLALATRAEKQLVRMDEYQSASGIRPSGSLVPNISACSNAEGRVWAKTIP